MTDEQKPIAWAVAAHAELEPNRLSIVVFARAVSTRGEAVEMVKAQPVVGPHGEIWEVAQLSPETVQSLALWSGEVRML